jgi:hypothetical protein
VNQPLMFKNCGQVGIFRVDNASESDLLKGLHQVTAWRREKGEWSHRTDLNRRPAVYETAALPLSYGGFRWY